MSQYGYGHSDPTGAPFDLYSGAVGVAASANYTIAGSGLVLVPAAAVSIGVITLPLNPPDGAVVEITNSGSGGTITMTTPAANTGDSILGATITSLTANLSIKYKYSLNGYVVGNSQVPGAVALNARTWFRVV